MSFYPFWHHRFGRYLLMFISLFFAQAQADNRNSLEINDEIEIDILQIGSPAPTSLIWFVCNQGDESIEFFTAQKLAKMGYQIYFPDMLSAHFLSSTPSNIAKVPTTEISSVVQHILKSSKSSQFVLVGGARAAVPVLKGLSDIKIKNTDERLKGALLITPRINSKKPEPGVDPVYITEAGLSRHPILILEGERTPNRWGLPHLIDRLSKSGSDVQSDLIKGVRGFFYLRTEKTVAESEMTDKLDQLIDSNIKKLGTFKP